MGKKYQGYIEMGTGLDDDSIPLAKEALVFMVVGINHSFKLPVAYFFIDGLSGKERAGLVQQCLTRLHDAGVDVVSLTFDGCAANLAMAKSLGCVLEAHSANFKTFFSHPSTKENVYVFLDACHMLKLVRNTLGDKQSLVDPKGGLVQWRFVDHLQKFQENEGLHLGIKLRLKHVL